MRPGRVAVVAFILAALVGAASYACPAEVMVVAGVSGTHGLGEAVPAMEARGELGFGPLYVEAAWSGADKLESRAGWLARGAAEVRSGPVGIGAAYSYRDGGAWAKHYPWARLSVGNATVRLIAEHALGGYNRETKSRTAELRTSQVVRCRLWNLRGAPHPRNRIRVLNHGWGPLIGP